MKLSYFIAFQVCSGVASLLAQTPLEVVPMPEVVVRAKSDPSLTVPDIDTKRRELAKIPGAAEVINSDSYKRGRSTTIRDALDFAPGVFVQSRFGAEEARISIRGSGIQRTFHGRGIELLQDDVPLNLADGSFDFQAVEPRTLCNSVRRPSAGR